MVIHVFNYRYMYLDSDNINFQIVAFLAVH